MKQAKTISIGAQYFDRLREKDCFYIDKTDFIRQWWDAEDVVTLITRPRRFGKTLNMSMLDCFFSTRYQGRGELFEGLSIWREERFRELQGTMPCIFLTFAGVKLNTLRGARDGIIDAIEQAYRVHAYLKDSGVLSAEEKNRFDALSRYLANDDPDRKIDDALVITAIQQLSAWLHAYHQKPVLILLDEYDTPLQEAWIGGYWQEIVDFIRALFNNTFKTNRHLARALLTGITRVSRESIFSDLNNMKVVTTTSPEYAEAFGFTEEEVFAAMEERGLGGQRDKVKRWYDGFCFGRCRDIYNPWSITQYLDSGVFDTYWADTSSNSLINSLIRRGSAQIKRDMETLLKGEALHVSVDEQVVYDQLTENENALWGLLLAAGYLKVEDRELDENIGEWIYRLTLTNQEVEFMFRRMIRRWFGGQDVPWNDFVQAMISGNLEEMNLYMNRVAQETFSSFDTGSKPSEVSQPERFYHGFVLGLIAGETRRYEIRSNRESGYGRYDVAMIPAASDLPAIVMEFKVHDPAREATLHDTACAALRQIRDRDYDRDILTRGVDQGRIRHYGFAFAGKKILIESDDKKQDGKADEKDKG